MGTIIGFVIGYIVGMRDGRNGSSADLFEAWNTIRRSSEFKAFVAGAPSLAGTVLRRGMLMLANGSQRVR